MELPVRAVLTLLIVMLGLALFMIAAMGFFPEANPIERDELQNVVERIHQQVTPVGTPEMSYTVSQDGSLYDYELMVNALRLQSKADIDIIVIVDFKDKRIKLTEEPVHIDADEFEGVPLTSVSIQSKIPPLKVVESVSESPVPGQLYFVGNFLVEVRTISRPTFVFVQSPCTMSMRISCKEATVDAKLSLENEKALCSEQRDPSACVRSYNRCGGEIDVQLLRYERPEESGCRAKDPVLAVTLKQEADRWKTGEIATLMFLKVPENPAYDDCWQRSLLSMTTECFDQVVGAAVVLIPAGEQPEE